MIPVRVLAQVVVVVSGLLGVATVAFVGRERLGRLPRAAPERIRAVGPHLAALGALLVLNSVVRDLGPQFSWIVGWNVTGTIHAIEGPFVAHLQSALARPALTAYFSMIYVYGYVFLLVFPLLAYFAHDDDGPLRRTIVAYGVNYGLGVVCYLAFIAYGPRNLMPELVESLLFTTYPKYQLLTSEVNSNTNVFPSLHTSLSVTVALLAAQTRDVYRGWFYVSTLVASSVVVATMYLGIHWGTDVAAGAVLAVLSVWVADRYVSE
ncbi:phosphatase PAP2 family protein [Halorussus salinisoli]|uniref:phosphatase PAP2 family protein n=1 Tax=Halorussus salinisoli TaxID=2558242 RepID=UPI0010C20E1F|nr:phosphatase PAP2 family protein [Halorussus salinisoli]